MLARRFTIVCLLMALFGMFFSMIVARAERSHSWEHGMVHGCSNDPWLACKPINRL